LTQGYEMVSLRWVTEGISKFVFPHINPEEHRGRNMYAYYSHDLLAFTEYVIASFVEKYQWVTWRLFYDDRSYPKQETDTC